MNSKSNIYKLSILLILFIPSLLAAQINDSINISKSDLSIQKELGYDRFIFDDLFSTEEIGNPELPVRIESYVLPIDAKVAGITLNSINRQKLSGEYYIFPAQPPRILDWSDPPEFVEPNPQIYNSTTPYPGKSFEIISDGYGHGYHIVTVKIYPVEYIPKTREIFLCKIDFTINYSLDKAKSDLIKPERQSKKRADLAKSYVNSLVRNVEDIERYTCNTTRIINESNYLNKIPTSSDSLSQLKSLSVIEELVPDYIIITNDELKPVFTDLSEWKTRKGIPSLIQTVEVINANYPGCDLQEKIRNYLKEAYLKWGADIFVLLGGDVNIVPARFWDGPCCDKSPTDLYYATISGTWNANNNNIFAEYDDEVDDIPDFFLGRASAQNAAEAQTFVNKIIAYEKYSNLGSSSYVNNNLFLTGFMDKGVCNVYYSSYVNKLKEYSDLYIANNINNWFVTDNHNCQFNSSDPYETPYAYPPHDHDYCNPYKPYQLYVIPGGGDCDPDYSGNQALNKVNAISDLNNGGVSGLGNFHIVFHKQHSGVTGLGLTKLTNEALRNSDFDNLANGEYNQILFSTGCKPATFSKDCAGEHYINNPNGGGVAFIGNADFGGYSDHVQFKYFCDALYETPSHPSQGYNLGFTFQKATFYGPSDKRKILTLLGDPEMPVWTAPPQIFSASSSPSTITNGENTITVTISNLQSGNTATICLQKDEEGYARQNVTSNGNYNFIFIPHTSGELSVTITSHNFKPYEAIIPVVTNQNQMLHINELNFDDDKQDNSNGNNDSQIDAGETIELEIVLKNSGSSFAANVSATLSCNSSYVTILNNQSNFGNIFSGGNKTSLTPYIFSIDKDAPEILRNNDLDYIQFTLVITDASSNTFIEEFNIDIFNPDLELGNKLIVSTTDGDELIEPNETVTFTIDLFNKGKAEATGVFGVLSTSSPYITSCSSIPRIYPDIAKYSTETNTITYQFSVDTSYIVDQPLDFTLQVENEYGKIWSTPEFDFNLLNKPIPLISTAIGFDSYQTEIELFWPKVDYIKGYNIYRSDADANGNDVGNYVKLNTFILPSAFYRDVDLDELTKYYYKVSIVSSDGNESDLSGHKLAWTSYDNKGIFPINFDISGLNIQTSINCADINNDGLMEIFAGGRVTDQEGYLVALNNDGTELIDIDQNETTYKGFAAFDAGVEATPAIGDLDQNSIYEVITMSRDLDNQSNNFITCYSTSDSDNDFKPDLLWERESKSSYGASIISNLDNSANGSLEVVYYHEYGTIKVYSHTGLPLCSFADEPDTKGSLAVADLDNDGDKEIIGAFISSSGSGIYVWHHDGSDFNATQPLYSLPGYNLCGSVIVCDLDNNGDKEILTSALKINDHEGRIVAIHHTGSAVSGWNGNQTIAYPNDWHTQNLAVGDLNHDDNLEVVALGTNVVTIWNKSGIEIRSTSIDNLNPGKLTPILADVDNDPEVEIIFGSSGTNKIFALNMDGTGVVGFPLNITDVLYGSPCVTDIDNNGKNEIIAASSNTIYMWETIGNSQLIEWGCERFDSYNTGEYIDVCPPTIISSNTTWNSNQSICGNIVIESGTLTITSNCSITMDDFSTLTIKAGGTLKIDGGEIMNANINALNGSHIIVLNNGYIKLSDLGRFNIDLGATFDYQFGIIDR